MLSKFIVALALASLTALAFEYLRESDSGTMLEREAAGQLDELRRHLFGKGRQPTIR